MKTNPYQCIHPLPFATIGIQLTNNTLCRLDYLPFKTKPQRDENLTADVNKLLDSILQQLKNYLANPKQPFNIPFELTGTTHQQKLWQALTNIPPGQTRTYGELATSIESCAQAVGNACRENPISIIIPCHRVVAKNHLGGYNGQIQGNMLKIKTWLLQHESLYSFRR